jgi:hypothetical protein
LTLIVALPNTRKLNRWEYFGEPGLTKHPNIFHLVINLKLYVPSNKVNIILRNWTNLLIVQLIQNYFWKSLTLYVVRYGL